LAESLPVLKIVPVDRIVIHEYHDIRRSEKLAKRIKEDGFLKDPPMVARLEEERYVHLDGANRIETLRLLGCRDILVQVVDYYDEEEVQLDSWCHLTKMDKVTFLSKLGDIRGIQVRRTDYETAGEALRERKVLCCIFFRDKDVYAIEAGEGLKERVGLLNEVVDLYKADITRDIVERREMAGRIDDLFRRHGDCNVTIVFPKFTPREIVRVAASKLKVPAGITRHIIKNRALRLYFPLIILESKALSLEEKNKLLEEFLKDKSPRVYAEPTVMYDE